MGPELGWIYDHGLAVFIEYDYYEVSESVWLTVMTSPVERAGQLRESLRDVINTLEEEKFGFENSL
jgi:hypothetical protein